MNLEAYQGRKSCESEANKFMYQFTDDIRIGIKEIDDEHKGFFSLIEEAQNMLDTSGIDVRKVATEVIQRLRTYAATHFAHEEAYMKKIGDSELPSQKLEHGDFTEKMHEISVEGLDEDAIRNKMTDLL